MSIGDNWPRLASMLVLSTMATSCKDGGGARGEYEYAISVDGGATKVVALELDGKRLAPSRTLPNGLATFNMKLAAADTVVGKSLAVVLETTCGETKLSAKPAFGIAKGSDASDEAKEREEAKEPGQSVLVEARFDAPEAADVYLDVDDAKGAAVSIGKTALEAKPDGQRVVLGTCAEAKQVKVGGDLVGELQVAKDNADEPGTAFIDVKGGHCYEKKLHVYLKSGEGDNVAPSTPEKLEGKRIYAVEIEHFLQPVPEEILAKDGVGFRVEIARCK